MRFPYVPARAQSRSATGLPQHVISSACHQQPIHSCRISWQCLALLVLSSHNTVLASALQVSVYDTINKAAQYSRKVRRLGEFHPTLYNIKSPDGQDIEDPLYGNMGGEQELVSGTHICCKSRSLQQGSSLPLQHSNKGFVHAYHIGACKRSALLASWMG